MTRRGAGSLIARAAASAGGLAFFSEWLEAAQAAGPHAHGASSSAPPEPDRWTAYEPKFFSPEDFHTLGLFTSILIPTDATPGAREAHVAAFIDFVVAAAAEYAPDTQKQWRGAMDWMRAQGFANSSAAEQLALVERMSAPERDPSAKHEGFPHYRLIKDMTVYAFYTSRVGLVGELEYKGNAYLTAFPACDHPEHRRV